MNGLTLRDEAREQLRHYTSRTGLSLGEMATRMGYARQSLLQFNSRSKYGTSDGGEIAKRILDYIQTNPPEIPIEVQGTLYETQNTVIIDHLISEVKDGRWALLYGPPGTQKTQTFKTRMVEAFTKSLDPDVIWVQVEEQMAPLGLLLEVGAGLGAYLKNNRHEMMLSIRYALRKRKSPLCLIIDEAQKLMRRPDTLEVLRDIGDKCNIGLLVAGHDDVEDLFQPRPHNQFAQWRSRVEQLRRRLEGLTEDEAKGIVQTELGQVPAKTAGILLKGSYERDIKMGREYISARRLFNAIRDVRKKLKTN